MRTIERSTAFKRDYRREMRGQYGRTLDERFAVILRALVNDELLSDAHRDHSLSGQWEGYRDCHVRPNLVLIYRKPDAKTLHLARLGSHSDLFGS